MSNRTCQAFLYSCDATRAWTGNRYCHLHSCSACTQQSQNRGNTSVSRLGRTFGKLESSPSNQVNAWEVLTIALYLLTSNIKGPLANQHFECRGSKGHGKHIRWCIPCSVPDSLRCQANYMFRNGYHLWCCPHTPRSHPRCKSTDVLRVDTNTNSSSFPLSTWTSSPLPPFNCKLLE